LLLRDDEVISNSIRTLDELKYLWEKNHSVASHVIFIGHGKENAINFGGRWVSPDELNKTLDVKEVSPKQFVSLCCHTGCANFGRKFSQFPICESLILPFQSVHGSIASQFCQTYFACHLLHGQTTRVAFKQARDRVTGTINFRLWKNGEMIVGPKT